MKLYCLSSHPNKPCFVLKWREMTIMLDCGLSAQTVLNFLPLPLVPNTRLNSLPGWVPREYSDPRIEGELKDCCNRILIDSPPEFSPPQSKIVDFAEVDVILISNYLCMLALPFITEDTGFNGVVHCTEPTMQIGRLFLEELVEWVEQSPKAHVAKFWKEIQHLLPPPLCDVFKPNCWRHLYTINQVNATMSKIRVVGYDEKIDIYGALTAIPVSSGYCLGSANWVIQSDYEKIAYISGSTTLTTHPKPMYQNPLKNVNVIIMTALTQTPTSNPDSMLGELCINTAMTLRNGGCVLLPCYPSGVVYDLFECLTLHLDTTGLGNYPLFFISPVADTSLAYSNILAEWLSQAKQNKVYIPEEPFPHGQLVKNSRLRHFKSIHAENFSNSYRQPCVVFCGHPSLRFGDAVHFMEMWSSNPNNTVIFTEPDFPFADALAPFQPVQMKVVHCPIDTSLNFIQASKLIRELKPGYLVVPDNYVRPQSIPPTSLPLISLETTVNNLTSKLEGKDTGKIQTPMTPTPRSDLLIETDRPSLVIKRGEVLKLPVNRKRVKAEMSSEVAASLLPVEPRPGIMLASMSGELLVNDNRYRIEMMSDESNSKTADSMPPRKRAGYEWGWLDVDQFLKRLEMEGVQDAVRDPNTGIIHLRNSDTIITLEENSTHIICEGNRQLRLKLRNALLHCLNKF